MICSMLTVPSQPSLQQRGRDSSLIDRSSSTTSWHFGQRKSYLATQSPSQMSGGVFMDSDWGERPSFPSGLSTSSIERRRSEISMPSQSPLWNESTIATSASSASFTVRFPFQTYRSRWTGRQHMCAAVTPPTQRRNLQISKSRTCHVRSACRPPVRP